MSAWLETELETYERHVELETVGQGAAIRAAIRMAAMRLQPKRFLYLGCAGGNGLEALPQARVVGIDLNEKYLEVARQRWGQEFLRQDLNQGLPNLGSFDLAFGALVFEYIDDLSGLIEGLARCVDGHLLVLLLATRENAPAVAESPYRKLLEPVGREFRYLSAERFIETAAEFGFQLESREEVPLPAGKHFVSILFKRRLS
jgi:2-polyprenyl-3-methyl-5-hydroxy-6-metoxy-1,4-benzoquinol methylase